MSGEKLYICSVKIITVVITKVYKLNVRNIQ